MLRQKIVAAFAALALALPLGLASVPASARTTQEELKPMHWSFDGPIGRFDQASLQRGYKVYAEVCSGCHSMNLMYYRNLCQQNGPFFDPKHPNPNDAPVCKAIAASIQVPDIDPDTGDAIQRPATPADHFKAPYANEPAARASNGGALPPDLSVMARAREGGPDYIYSLLSGYPDNPPDGLTVPDGKYYNPYFPGDLSSAWTGAKNKVPKGGFIGMPFQLVSGRVTFDDNSPSTTEAMAKDVATFLAWTAEPKQTERKEAGLAVMIYLILFAGVLYLSYRRIWRNVAH
jgi:ubiquinol-cytochrome c reductase cytochrome c1 subunit